MTFIRCTNCGKEVSSDVLACPFCGLSIKVTGVGTIGKIRRVLLLVPVLQIIAGFLVFSLTESITMKMLGGFLMVGGVMEFIVMKIYFSRAQAGN
ncbi:MAG: zinc-ribbon domain-containing protein [Nitrospinae bacterium]|nr:zinc-ribbon domain-containing protein [Nitrospinota bacterium]